MVIFSNVPQPLTRLRRTFIRCLLLAQAVVAVSGMSTQVAAATPAPGTVEAARVSEIETYLSKMNSLRADFVQIEPTGGTSSGNLYYVRPDKMRLDYDSPNPVLIVANGSQVIYHDRKLGQVSHLFTSQTPLAFLLKKKVKLSGDVTVTDFEEMNGEILLTLVQTDEPELGTVELAFGNQPLELRPLGGDRCSGPHHPHSPGARRNWCQDRQEALFALRSRCSDQERRLRARLPVIDPGSFR